MASAYHEESDFQLETGLDLLDILSPQSTAVVLDIGCGTGRLSKILSDRLVDGRVVGVDPDEERIKIAMDEGKGRTNLQFMVGSDQTFPEDQYDIVFSNVVIHWIKDKRETFKKVYANLKPGGKFGFTTSAKGDSAALPQLMVEVLQCCKPEGGIQLDPTYYETVEDYRSMALEAGFQVSLAEIKDINYVFKSIDSYINFFYGVFKGQFDRQHPSLLEWKKNYEGKTIPFDVKCLTIVLTKPQ
ncbi:PREDICTED: uncharacterized methyltransferase C70.08c-like [Amphimedon queenslandica]|uniref:Uncharacterized protein n=1 Tax=Amphimedon queenslandica TaxID=400682 RepID=A0A1X7U4M3_AMPQE|nr:PREDICTED: uncharacterized methyltransferase C70.08c-like [Amphimedon queenslandica]|eukprot:XP_011406109.1 PREDICTED: uncharacterized methyltransferase C70.08c-like [Amphimedon queenslandica]